MIKKSMYVMAVLAFALTTSCKKEDALSKVDPTSSDVPMNYEAKQVDANGNPMPVQPVTENGQTPEQAASAPIDGKYPVMLFGKKEHDFGVINEGDKVETYFTFTNTGDADLIISNASGSCGCTVPDYPKEPIKPGKSSKMKVTFDSNGKPGKQQKSVTIVANTLSTREVLTINVEVTPKVKPVETQTTINQ